MKGLGENLKALRLEKQMTLKELSKRSQVSSSQLSQIERNVSVPTVTRLQKIAEALETKISSFFAEEESSKPETAKEPISNNSRDLHVVRRGERKKLIMPWGAWYEMLCPDLQHKIEFIYLYYPVGAKARDPYTHDGEECGLVLEGTYKGDIGGREIILEPGDSIYYNSLIPHSWEVIGDKDVRAIWAITPPSF